MKLPQTLNNTPRDIAMQTSEKRLLNRDHSAPEDQMGFEKEWKIDENIEKMRESFNRRLKNNTVMH